MNTQSIFSADHIGSGSHGLCENAIKTSQNAEGVHIEMASVDADCKKNGHREPSKNIIEHSVYCLIALILKNTICP